MGSHNQVVSRASFILPLINFHGQPQIGLVVYYLDYKRRARPELRIAGGTFKHGRDVEAIDIATLKMRVELQLDPIPHELREVYCEVVDDQVKDGDHKKTVYLLEGIEKLQYKSNKYLRGEGWGEEKIEDHLYWFSVSEIAQHLADSTHTLSIKEKDGLDIESISVRAQFHRRALEHIISEKIT